jgi:hypothetical protein
MFADFASLFERTLPKKLARGHCDVCGLRGLKQREWTFTECGEVTKMCEVCALAVYAASVNLEEMVDEWCEEEEAASAA